MGIDDRDYMRRSVRERETGFMASMLRGRWWKKLTWQAVVGAIVALAGVVSATAWFLSNVSFIDDTVDEYLRPGEGSLIVNLNTATTEELEALPGIGPSLAVLIIASRPYTTVEELERVSGIGPRTVDSLRPYVKVEGETEKAR